MANRTWRRRVFLLPAELEDELAAALWEAGTLGVETRPAGPGDDRLRIEAWFDGEPDLSPLEALTPRGLEPAGGDEVADADWLAPWRAAARPFPVGERFLLDPREPDVEPEQAETVETGGRTLLRLPARRAFGTGSHESTRLALELLEAVPPSAESVLDVGTGTGVLAFAALVLGARRVAAFDLDLEAVAQARVNSRLNALSLQIFAGTSAALAPAARFGRVVVNVVPELVWDELPRLAAAVAEGGGLVFSGILVERGEAVCGRLADLGFAVAQERRAGEWVAFLFRRTGEPA